MAITLRDDTTTDDRRLDRLVSFDEASRAFSIRTLLEEADVRKPRSYTWSVPVKLDQGAEGACVGFGWSHELAARPVSVPGISNQFARETIYWEAQKLDDWEGGSYPGALPQYEGTSVLAGAKVVQKMGLIREYRWAFGLDDVRLALGYAGPVVLGLNWYQGMFAPQGDGRIAPTGNKMGGHCILAYSVSERLKIVKLWNSWGGDWWAGGSWCYLTFEDLGRLLDEQGEACVPIGRRLGA